MTTPEQLAELDAVVERMVVNGDPWQGWIRGNFVPLSAALKAARAERDELRETLEAYKEANDLISRIGFVDGLKTAIDKEAKRGASLAARLAKAEELLAMQECKYDEPHCREQFDSLAEMCAGCQAAAFLAESTAADPKENK